MLMSQIAGIITLNSIVMSDLDLTFAFETGLDDPRKYLFLLIEGVSFYSTLCLTSVQPVIAYNNKIYQNTTIYQSEGLSSATDCLRAFIASSLPKGRILDPGFF